MLKSITEYHASVTGFTIGMIAFGIWVAVGVGLWLLFKRSPRHPFRSIGDFRRAGRKLAEPLPQEPDTSIRLVEPGEAPPEVLVSEDQLELFRPAEPAHAADEFIREERLAEPNSRVVEDTAELDEINNVITAVTSEKAPAPKSNSKAPARKRTAAMNKPVRKIGKLTDVVVDEEGKPEADPR